ncbi:MAG: hypothetical protein Q9218_004281 [Villophora microphyllina]
MAFLFTRSEFTDNASAKASSGWNACMNRSMCKYPAILGIILAVLAILACIYCALRCLSCCCCCDCLSGGRYQRKSKYKYADLHSSPYTGYQQQQPPPPGYVEQQQQQPPMYARFDTSNGRRRGDDSLPAMPVWKEAGEKRVYEDGHVREVEKGDVEMGPLHGEKEREARQPMLAPSQYDPAPGYQEMDGSGDLGQKQGQGQRYVAYQPFSQGYRPYGEHPPQAGKGSLGNSWRDV